MLKNGERPLNKEEQEFFYGLYKDHYKALFVCAYQLGIGREAAEDYVQDAFTMAIRHIDDIKINRNPRRYLKQALKNVIGYQFRSLRYAIKLQKRLQNELGYFQDEYQDEFEYLISAGIVLDTSAISTPVFPLTQAVGKNLLKLYLNDVGLLTDVLYGSNIRAILDDETGINLGSVYESVVAQELAAHGRRLFYYDNRSKGEVDFLIDDYDSLSAVPIEVKSGKDYTIHSALSAFVKNEDYHVKKACVLSNTREITTNGRIIYLPIYDVMFLGTAEEMNGFSPLRATN